MIHWKIKPYSEIFMIIMNSIEFVFNPKKTWWWKKFELYFSSCVFALKRFAFFQKWENCVCSQVFLFYPRYFASVLKCLHFLEKLRLYAKVLRFSEKCVLLHFYEILCNAFVCKSFAFLKTTLRSLAKVFYSSEKRSVCSQKFCVPPFAQSFLFFGDTFHLLQRTQKLCKPMFFFFFHHIPLGTAHVSISTFINYSEKYFLLLQRGHPVLYYYSGLTGKQSV